MIVANMRDFSDTRNYFTAKNEKTIPGFQFQK